MTSAVNVSTSVVGVRRAIAVTTVAPGVQCHGRGTRRRREFGRCSSRKAILAAAVQHQDRGPIGRRVRAAVPLVSHQG